MKNFKSLILLIAISCVMFSSCQNQNIYSEYDKKILQPGDTIYVEYADDLLLAVVQKNDVDKRVITIRRLSFFSDKLYMLETRRYTDLP